MNIQNLIIRIAVLSFLVAVSASGLLAQAREIVPKSVDKPLPNLILNNINGQKWSLHEQRGRVVLLNFWATWCAPCREEIPSLVRLFDKYKADRLAVVGVSLDSENPARIKAFIKKYRMNYPVILTVPGSRLTQQEAVPITILIDQSGVLAKKYIGAIKEDVLEKDIKELLGKKSAETDGKTAANQR